MSKKNPTVAQLLHDLGYELTGPRSPRVMRFLGRHPTRRRRVLSLLKKKRLRHERRAAKRFHADQLAQAQAVKGKKALRRKAKAPTKRLTIEEGPREASA